MAVQIFDLTRATLSLPETLTKGNEVTYAGRATRGGVAQTLKYHPAGGAIGNADEWNTLIQVPDEEHWFLRSFMSRVLTTQGTIDPGATSAHLWRAISVFGTQGDAWTNFDPNAGRDLDGLSPFNFAAAGAWLQILDAKTQVFGNETWRFNKEMFLRHLYPREIIDIRYVAGGNGAASPQVSLDFFLDVVRYPVSPRILERLRLIHGEVPGATIFGAMIEASQDMAPESDT